MAQWINRARAALDARVGVAIAPKACPRTPPPKVAEGRGLWEPKYAPEGGRGCTRPPLPYNPNGGGGGCLVHKRGCPTTPSPPLSPHGLYHYGSYFEKRQQEVGDTPTPPSRIEGGGVPQHPPCVAGYSQRAGRMPHFGGFATLPVSRSEVTKFIASIISQFCSLKHSHFLYFIFAVLQEQFVSSFLFSISHSTGWCTFNCQILCPNKYEPTSLK